MMEFILGAGGIAAIVITVTYDRLLRMHGRRVARREARRDAERHAREEAARTAKLRRLHVKLVENLPVGCEVVVDDAPGGLLRPVAAAPAARHSHRARGHTPAREGPVHRPRPIREKRERPAGERPTSRRAARTFAGWGSVVDMTGTDETTGRKIKRSRETLADDKATWGDIRDAEKELRHRARPEPVTPAAPGPHAPNRDAVDLPPDLPPRTS